MTCNLEQHIVAGTGELVFIIVPENGQPLAQAIGQMGRGGDCGVRLLIIYERLGIALLLSLFDERFAGLTENYRGSCAKILKYFHHIEGATENLLLHTATASTLCTFAYKELPSGRRTKTLSEYFVAEYQTVGSHIATTLHGGYRDRVHHA